MAQTVIGALKNAASQHGMTVEEMLAKRASGLKFCWSCKEWRPLSWFNVDVSRYDGLAAKCRGGEKLSRSEIARKAAETKRASGKPSPLKDRKYTPERCAKMSEAMRGKPSPMAGKKHSIESRQKMSQTMRLVSPKGKEARTYKDGKHAERMGLRYTPELKRWRFDVFARDRFTCQDCGDSKGGNLNAHHIKSWADFPEERFNLDNGVTLCVNCHKKRHAK